MQIEPDESPENSVELDRIRIHRLDTMSSTPTPPGIKMKQRQLEIDERRSKLYWSCCSGSKISPEMTKYLVSVIFSAAILSFSFVMIASTNQNREIYFNLISFIIGVFIKQPSPSKK
jgi:hypothetical protein